MSPFSTRRIAARPDASGICAATTSTQSSRIGKLSTSSVQRWLTPASSASPREQVQVEGVLAAPPQLGVGVVAHDDVRLRVEERPRRVGRPVRRGEHGRRHVRVLRDAFEVELEEREVVVVLQVADEEDAEVHFTD